MAAPMGKGVRKSWTPEVEEHYKGLLADWPTFAERYMIMLIMTALKYDSRTRAGKRAIAQRRLQLAIANDEDLEAIALIEAVLADNKDRKALAERVEDLKKARTKIRERGIKRSELECQ